MAQVAIPSVATEAEPVVDPTKHVDPLPAHFAPSGPLQVASPYGRQETTDSTIPPPVPEGSQLPKDLRATVLEARIHRNAEQVVKEVNKYFLENWPFRTEKQRRRFVEEGYAWFVCILCPLSLDERMHWGCRLLTLGFLIDDALDRMSVAQGVEYNAKVIECARGTLLPDRTMPAQWMMYDLFECMRAVDKPLADELLIPTIDFLLAQVDESRTKPMALQEYFEYRDADLGKGLISGIMRFCAGLRITAEEMELVKSVEENAMKHITFVNDIVSYEKEAMAAKAGFELGSICSSVPIVRELAGVSEGEAKRIMWQMARAWEVRHLELVAALLDGYARPELAVYLKGVEHQIAGNERWTLLTPRYTRVGGLGFAEGRL